MIKRILTLAVLGIAGTFSSASNADAQVYFRPIAPVRRVAARAVLPPYPVARPVARVALPPYPVARSVIAAPVYSPWVGGYSYSAYYGTPVVYGSGVIVY